MAVPQSVGYGCEKILSGGGGRCVLLCQVADTIAMDRIAVRRSLARNGRQRGGSPMPRSSLRRPAPSLQGGLGNARSQQFTAEHGPVIRRKCDCSACRDCGDGRGAQNGLAVGAANSRLEKEADAVADVATRGAATRAQRRSLTPSRSAGSQTSATVRRSLGVGAGSPLGGATRRYFEPRLGADLGDVRIHTGGDAAAAAKRLNARAFTAGRDIGFAAGRYAPETASGRWLIAHELAHTLQSEDAPSIQRNEDEPESDANADRDAEERASDYSRVSLHYNGTQVIVRGDGNEIFRVGADSGRPVRIREEDAEACGGDTRTDTYLNDARFVGIRNRGPIPEGRYTFRPPRITRFTPAEQWDLLVGGIMGQERIQAGGISVHTGDWGSGRVALTPQHVDPGPCGNTRRRSAFFLHGGLLAGSSGCIDVGGNFDRIARFLEGYRRPVTLTVEYENGPSFVGFFTGLGGALGYGAFAFRHGPLARIGLEAQGGELRAVPSIAYDVILDWAGGALSAGARLDVPMNDRGAFVRAALTAGANFRIFRALYGRLVLGGHLELSEGGVTPGFEAGGGVGYNFGPVEAEILYNVLRPASDDDRVHQVMGGLGVHF